MLAQQLVQGCAAQAMADMLPQKHGTCTRPCHWRLLLLMHHCHHLRCCLLATALCAPVQQVGICEHWLQLAHMLTVMGGPDLPPAVCAAMWKRLPGEQRRRQMYVALHLQ
jgi:hypothetical protein